MILSQPTLAALIGLPPQFMLLLTLAGIFYLFRRDFRQRPDVSPAIWLPIVWIFVIASRPVSQWLATLGVSTGGPVAVEEGSSLDALVLMGLIALGVRVLFTRRVKLSEVLKDNRWLAVLFVYSFIAIFWSDYAFISFKRWIKILGHPVMILILFTEFDQDQALTTTMKRCAYVIFPLSICWMKYFPSLGRGSSELGGMENTGVTRDKNSLGSVCLVFGIFFLWRGIQTWRQSKSRSRKDELRLVGGLLLCIAYCLRKSHSSTSVLSFLLGAAIMLGLGFRFVNIRQLSLYIIAAVLVLAAAQMMFDVYGSIADLTGHSSTLEGRGRLWEVLWQTDTHPIFGTGFESYWLGDRIQAIWDQPEFKWHPNQAHNGYLEAYINLGAVGLIILVGVILMTFQKAKRELVRDFEWGRLTMSYLAAIVAHNWTEAGFKGLSVIFFTLLLIAINYPRRYPRGGANRNSPEYSLQEPRLVYSEVG